MIYANHKNGYLRLLIIPLLLSIVPAFKHILLKVFFPWYFMHATYHMIKAKGSKYVGDVDEGTGITPRNMALRVILEGVIL
jgi:hypothetical protein